MRERSGRLVSGAVGCLLLVALAGCGSITPPPRAEVGTSADLPCAAGSLTGQGSSAQANAMVTWIRQYQASCPDAAIEYHSIGSGAGIETFIDGQGDFGGTDSLLSAADQPAADARCGAGPAIHLPMVVGPIGLAYNVAGISDLQLTPATIAKIFAGTATTWDDPAIAEDNPDLSLPPTPIRPVHRSDGSGTTDNFTTYLAETAPDHWEFGSDRSWPGPHWLAAPGNEGVSAAITSSEGAIGYIEWSFAESFQLRTARVRNGAGELVELSTAGAGLAVAGAEVTGEGADLRLALDYRTSVPRAYPIVLVAYEIVCQRGNAPESLDLLKGFFSYTASPAGQAVLADIGYAPLPEEVRSQVAAVVDDLG